MNKFQFFKLNLAELCLKCIILITNIQKLLCAGDSTPPQHPLTFDIDDLNLCDLAILCFLN